ncbi:odorant receptor Or1-like [Zophobas morio]|uniref:odorant receptor Or1-like n=1 Tax=Zophobas morio TaxID=2755281 RepID=UPI003083BDD4
MLTIDWNFTIKRNIFILQLLGLWPQEDEVYKLNLYSIYAFVSIVVIMGGHNFFQTVNICFVYTDLEALATTIFITSTEVLVLVKVYFFTQNIGRLKKLLSLLKKDVFQPRNERQVEMIKPILNFWKNVHGSFMFIVVSTIIVQSINKNQLPFSAWYPYDYTISPLYELTYLYQVVGMWYIALSNVNIGTLFYALLTYVVVQCDILCDDCKNLTGPLISNQRIISCIKHHKEILSFSESVNDLFEMVILGQFVTSTIVIATTLFMLTLVDPLSKEGLITVLYAMAVITEIFIYCWFGNQVDLKTLL